MALGNVGGLSVMAALTVSVNGCVAVLTEFVAVKVMLNGKPVADVGVPLRTPVAALKVRPAGRVPVSLNVGAGLPVAVTVKEPAPPTVKVAWLALVKAGAWLTVRVKLWVAAGLMPLLAVMVKLNVYGPAPRLGGVPLRTPLEEPTDSQDGAPVKLKAGAGLPVAVTVKLPGVPTVNVVALALVIAGGWLTVRVKLCVASGMTPLLAVIVKLNVYGPAPKFGGVPVRRRSCC